MFVAFFASLLAIGFAAPPIWYADGPCGQSQYADAGENPLPIGKIVGGVEARPYEFPWQVSIRSTADRHYCGGSLINDRWVVTAAQCMAGQTPDVITLAVGEHERGASSTVRQLRDAELIFVHESYNDRSFENDIAVVKAVSSFVLNVNVQPICAPDPANTYFYSLSQVSGWGTLSSGAFCCPLILRYTTLNVTTNSYCQSIYIGDIITNDMLCASDNAGDTTRDFCEEDTGGPLSVKGADGIFTLIGIASWQIDCAAGYPGVYTRVSYHVTWVTDIINNN